MTQHRGGYFLGDHSEIDRTNPEFGIYTEMLWFSGGLPFGLALNRFSRDWHQAEAGNGANVGAGLSEGSYATGEDVSEYPAGPPTTEEEAKREDRSTGDVNDGSEYDMVTSYVVTGGPLARDDLEIEFGRSGSSALSDIWSGTQLEMQSNRSGPSSEGSFAAKGGVPGKPDDTLKTKEKGGGKDTSGDGGGNTSDVVQTTYVSGGNAATTYNLEIVFDGSWTTTLQRSVIEVADYLSTIILSDLPDVGDIDDIRISATLGSIDGRGGVVGSAGPSYMRLDDGSLLPYEASMEFDVIDAEAYVNNGLWYDLVLHEMFHAIGFGSLWNALGLTTGTIEEGNLRFVGENAIAAYHLEFSDLATSDPAADLGVPIETDGGFGTAGGHWDEAYFDNELMTGYIDDRNYLSEMSIAALEDMGYDTVFDSSLIS